MYILNHIKGSNAMKPAANSALTQEQKDMIFENMSDGIMTIDKDGNITYFNSACKKIFNIDNDDIIGESFKKHFMSNTKNRAFNKFFSNRFNNHEITERKTIKYLSENEVHYFEIDVSLIKPEDFLTHSDDEFNGMIILIEDITDRVSLRHHEHDCAYIFAGLIICISIYLFMWTLLKFTLNIYLKSSTYTKIIEGISFILFLEVIFFTTFSLKDIGLIPNFKRWKKNIIETIITGTITCVLLLLSKLILTWCGYQIKAYYIGGSRHGAYTYIFTAFIQEFLARGVMQTSVKSLMKVKYQKFFSVLLTSLLFSLMHIPFGFYFMFGAFALSLALSYIYERQQDIWGCAVLHWACGYLAMCLFF